ncbi:hypothetical protein TNCV_3898641 [Trichonephila clavipes]|nr:hypothetical protein TNCV_3898641 [Trichonephila clavipes]
MAVHSLRSNSQTSEWTCFAVCSNRQVPLKTRIVEWLMDKIKSVVVQGIIDSDLRLENRATENNIHLRIYGELWKKISIELYQAIVVPEGNGIRISNFS